MKKNLFLMFMMFFLLDSNKVHGQTVCSDLAIKKPSPTIIYGKTPFGTSVEIWEYSLTTLTDAHKNASCGPITLARIYSDPTLGYKISDDTWRYNCHAYAWISQNLPGNSIKNWLNDPDPYINDCSYYQVTSPITGDRVIYRGWNEDRTKYIALHSAVVASNSNGKIYVRSKWGPGYLMFHELKYCPYPTGDIKYYRFTGTSCQNPGTVYVTNVAKRSFMVSFPQRCSYYGWQIRFKVGTATSTAAWQGTRTISNGANVSYYNFTSDLRLNTTYTVEVKSAAPNTTCSGYTKTFTTPSRWALNSPSTTLATRSNGEEQSQNDGQVIDLLYEPTMSVSPNPSSSNFTATIDASQYQEATLSIFDMTGKVIATKIAQLSEGTNTIQFDQKLPAGMYIIKARVDGSELSQKLVQQ